MSFLKAAKRAEHRKSRSDENNEPPMSADQQFSDTVRRRQRHESTRLKDGVWVPESPMNIQEFITRKRENRVTEDDPRWGLKAGGGKTAPPARKRFPNIKVGK